jgi:hypothetical protein
MVDTTKYGSRAKLGIGLVVAVLAVYILLVVVTGIRTLVTGGAREQELKGLLSDAKKVFLDATKTFDTLDDTYGSLDVEYQTVVTSAESIAEDLDTVDGIADDITKEFFTVAETFTNIEDAYEGAVKQYNDVCSIASLAYIKVGAKSDGMPIQVIHYPHGGDLTNYKIVDPILVPEGTLNGTYASLIYTDVDGYVDSEAMQVPDGPVKTQAADVVPVLHAYDADGTLFTRLKPGQDEDHTTDGTVKTVTVEVCIADGRYQIVSMETKLVNHTEKFIVDIELYNRMLDVDDSTLKWGVTPKSVHQNSLYVLTSSGGGKLDLKIVPVEEAEKIVSGTVPKYKPQTLSDMTKLQTDKFDSITPHLDKVKQKNKEKAAAMEHAAGLRTTIDESQQKRLDLLVAYKTAVTDFDNFSVERLVPEKDFLGSYCTVM